MRISASLIMVTVCCAMVAAGSIVPVAVASRGSASTFQQGRVEGSVVDPTGARVEGAVVTLRDVSGAPVAETQTDSEGRFVFSEVPQGRYQVEVDAPGFALPERPFVTVGSGKTASLSVRLEVAAITDRADISATDPIYTLARTAKLGSEYADVNDLALKRDTGTITFKNGTIYFLPAIEGKVTGAVFVGQGEFQMTPVLWIEQRHLSIFTGQPSITEQFSKMVLRFTDSTYEEIKKSAEIKSGAAASSAQSVLDDNRRMLRRGKRLFGSAAGIFLRYNLDARILIDLTRPYTDGLFHAYFDGKRYGDMLYGVDPLGGPWVTPEEVFLVNFNETSHGIWVSSHISQHYRSGSVFDENHQLIDLEHHKIDATIKGKRLEATVETTLKAAVDGVRVLPFDLFPRLRIKSVKDEQGRELRFIQEDKNQDGDLFVVMPEGLKLGQQYKINFHYAGDDAVSDSGGGNYSLDTRANWYPNSDFGDRATYDMTLRVEKGLTMVATGQPLGETHEGDFSVSRWKSDVPLAVAGFNYGKFRMKSVEDKNTNYVLESYANREIPDYLRNLQRNIEAYEDATGERVEMTIGALNTVSMMDKARAEAQLSIDLFSKLFGPLPYGRIAMTQQPYFSFGQAWPMLVYMPLSAYLDSTYRHQLGMDPGNSFYKIVGPHEVAHQWWGHIIGWKSYRDQWMSEGFAHCSAAMFAQLVHKNDLFVRFWKEQREQITQKNRLGKRPTDVGGVYMGYRLNTPKTGPVAQAMIYPKGGFILHMLRMMMWDPKTGDERFSAMMRDFVKTHFNSNVSTQDFQRAVERHITKDMDMLGNGKMDWFFIQWVYGTSIPDYKLEHRTESGAGGKVKLVFKVTQSNVEDNFMMRVPIYLDLDGRITRLGSVGIYGNSTTEELSVLLDKKPKKVMLCYYEDVLCTTDAR